MSLHKHLPHDFPLALRSFIAILAIALFASLTGGNSQAHAQSRLVTIQGGGLQFLDATQPDRYNLGLTAVVAEFTNAQSQQWLIADAGNGAITIQQRSSGLFLDAHENAAEGYFVVLRTRQTGDSTQLWRMTDYGGGFVTFQQVSSGRFLDAAQGFQVVTGAQGSQSQEWRLGAPY